MGFSGIIKTAKRFSRRATRLRRRILRTRGKRLWIPALSAVILFIFISMQQHAEDQIKIDPKAYSTLLNTIAKGESRGNYNAYYGNAGNTDILFTEMSVGEVMEWQKQYVENGSPSSAVGKYQIIRPTMAGLVKQMNIGTDEKYDEAMQDRMAIVLMERRGSLDYVSDRLSSEQFAANLAKEWASLPKATGDNPDKSYYEGDGLNKAHIKVEEVFDSLQPLKSKEYLL